MLLRVCSSKQSFVFRYDRSRFRDEPDFDDRSMENNRYSSIMQEEMRSARIGNFYFFSTKAVLVLTIFSSLLVFDISLKLRLN